MKNLPTITVLIILVTLSGCISVRSGGSPERKDPQDMAGATDSVIIVSAAPPASGSNAAMTTDGRAAANGTQEQQNVGVQ